MSRHPVLLGTGVDVVFSAFAYTAVLHVTPIVPSPVPGSLLRSPVRPYTPSSKQLRQHPAPVTVLTTVRYEGMRAKSYVLRTYEPQKQLFDSPDTSTGCNVQQRFRFAQHHYN
eukprot:3692783-Pleurochrysis_carterae.AAC.2